ncbi:TIR domain-containing protein [Sedimenticola selenatireducens]|uniref:TIR domain-containing protein n=1 Tax=Sedimenticola selenatireducens TaxID=191960 RepID=UPI00048F1082|nr:TIR domain-containing protein [Sedimenticola selenatireducens]
MSLRKKRREIERLIAAFEAESDKFHDLKFKKFLFSPEKFKDEKFESPNHTIMLWQYYGDIDIKDELPQLMKDIQTSDLQWGMRGAKLSSFAVLEGEACKLFARMANRAGSLFNKNEAEKIKSRTVAEIVGGQRADPKTTITIVNDNPLAIWVNYLLYHLSLVHPGRESAKYIQPDPFSLSLLALERLLEKPEVTKVDTSLKKVESINFKVALSFPGEKRSYVSNIADILRASLGDNQMFYDFDYQSQIAKPNADTLIQNIYRNQSDLVVVFFCKEYAEKEWCGLEWRAVRDIIKSKDSDRVMFVRFDNEEIEGVFSIDGYIDANNFSEKKVAQFILERIQLQS